jgi:tetratricopeptide (TPR) repeat protein
MSSRGDHKKAGSNANDESSHYHHHRHADNVQVHTMDANAKSNMSVPEPMDTNTNMNDRINIDIDWQKVLSDPSLVPCFLEQPSVRETVGRSKIDSTTAGLTYIPWELRVKGAGVVPVPGMRNRDDVNAQDLDTASKSIPDVVTTAPSTTNDDDNNDNKRADDIADSNDQKPTAILISKNGNTSNGSTDHNSSSNTLDQRQQQQPYFPVDLETGQSTDYLSLRRQQNRAWADERLYTGIQLAQLNKYTLAEKAYQQGLDLVPNHVDLMVAAAALHANQGIAKVSDNRGGDSDFHQTRALQLLEQALREDPQHANAAMYKKEIEAYQQKQQLAATLAAQRPAKADRAMQDASLERSFEIGNTTNGGCGASASAAVNSATAYPLLGSDSEHDRDDHDRDKRSRKKKHKHKKRHKKKSKRHHRHRRRSSSYYDSDSDTDDNDNYDDEDSIESSRKRSRGKSKRRKERKRSRKEESEPIKGTTAGVVPESVVDNGSHHDKDKDCDTDSSQEDSTRRGYKRRRKDRKHKRTRLSIRDDVSSSGALSDSGETVDSLQIGLERKGGRPATRAYRHEEVDGDDETKGG